MQYTVAISIDFRAHTHPKAPLEHQKSIILFLLLFLCNLTLQHSSTFCSSPEFEKTTVRNSKIFFKPFELLNLLSLKNIFSHILFINEISFLNVSLVISASCNNVNNWRPLYTLPSDKIMFWQTIHSNFFNLDWRLVTLNFKSS